MKQIRILGILVEKLGETVLELQATLSKYGNCIRTRLGLHDLEKPGCEGCGFIILDLVCSQAEMHNLEKELNSIKGIRIQKMEF